MAIVTLALCFVSVLPAGAICIHSPVRVRHLQGRAVAETKRGLEPIGGVTVRVVRGSLPGEDVATATTDADGRFSVDGLAPGRYSLVAESRPLSDISVQLVIRRTRFWQGRDDREVYLGFGYDLRPCGGSWVRVVKPSVAR